MSCVHLSVGHQYPSKGKEGCRNLLRYRRRTSRCVPEIAIVWTDIVMVWTIDPLTSLNCRNRVQRPLDLASRPQHIYCTSKGEQERSHLANSVLDPDQCLSSPPTHQHLCPIHPEARSNHYLKTTPAFPPLQLHHHHGISPYHFHLLCHHHPSAKV